MLHITLGKHRKTRTDIQNIGTDFDPTKRGEMFIPVPHISWVNAIESAAYEVNIKLWGFKFTTSRYYFDDSEFYGSAMFSLPGDEETGITVPRSLGFQFSNGGKRVPIMFLGGCFGTEGEGAFSNYSEELPRHAKADVSKDILEFVKKIPKLSKQGDHWNQQLKSMPLDDDIEAEIIVTAGRKEVCPWSRLALCDAYCQKVPKRDRTLWTMVEGMGRSIARNAPSKQLQQLNAAYLLIWDFYASLENRA